jgi:hypothetical protein
MLTSFQLWLVALAFLVAFCALYADEIPAIFDWLAWSCGALVMQTRLRLWKLYLGPRLKLETWWRMRRAQRRISTHYKNETTQHKKLDD